MTVEGENLKIESPTLLKEITGIEDPFRLDG